MSTTVRDPWADARQAATDQVLDPEVTATRRRLRLRWAVRLVLGFAALAVVFLGLQRLVGQSLDDVRWLPSGSPWLGATLAGLGFVVMVVGGSRSTSGNAVVTPEDYLDRAGRRWVRAAIAEGSPVPAERRDVVLDTARRAAGDADRLLPQVGWILLVVGLLVMGPNGPLLVLFPALLVWQVVEAVRQQRRVRQARRWLARNA